MSKEKINLGKYGEEKAVRFLKKNGYKVLEQNFRSSLGEIDIVAKDKNCICFVEVKTRNSQDKGLPQESITTRKQHKLSQLALVYLKNKKLLNKPARFDVVSIIQDSSSEDEIDIIKNAFSLDSRYLY